MASDFNRSCVTTTSCVVCKDWIVWQYSQSTQKLDEREADYLLHKATHKSPSHTGNGVYQGAFAFTLTKSPKDSHTVGDMLGAVRKVMSQKTVPVVKYAWYYEDKGRDENGNAIHPHIHGMYETATHGRIPARQWCRSWDLWDENSPMGQGFRGGYHRPVEHDEAYDDYIKKDGGMHESKGLE